MGRTGIELVSPGHAVASGGDRHHDPAAGVPPSWDMSNDVPGGMVLVAGGCPAGCGTGVPARAPRPRIGVSCSSPPPQQCLHRSDIYHSNDMAGSNYVYEINFCQPEEAR